MKTDRRFSAKRSPYWKMRMTIPEILIVDDEPDMLELLEIVKRKWPELTVIMMTAYGTIETAVYAMKQGAHDFAGRVVHELSNRREHELVAVNCPTVPEQILESELFGYKKGAFTHATQNKIGLFQQADAGSIFLDEIGDISPAIQTKLLRVLQKKEIKPLGDTRTVKVDVRIIASTNQNLKEKIRNGLFREDFYYRLNVLPVEIPPLRERPEDIP